MREWSVAGAVIEREGALLMVCNRRRDGRCDWSPPGGVIDPGESPLEALTREVREETGLEVTVWSEALYTVEVVFADLGSHLRVVAHRADVWSGELVLADPDGIVVDAEFAGASRLPALLDLSPPWVREPLSGWLAARDAPPAHAAFRASGQRLSELDVRRI